MAEGVFAHMVREAGLQEQITVDSCGTGGWHAGEAPHPGTQDVLARHGITYQHQARQLQRDDLASADYLIAMDSENLASIRRLGSTGAEVALLLDFARGVETVSVPDPYYSGRFEEVYDLVVAGCQGLMEHIRRQQNL
jgi:protein-tyrosine phosphatase